MSSSDFTTKDSGARVQFSTGMQRDVTAGKPRFDLIAPESMPYRAQMLTRWALLMARGAEKYGDRNWEQAATADELARFRQSAYRHFMQWYHGETDEDHAAAVLFNVTGAEYVQRRLAEDPAPPVYTAAEWDAAVLKVTGRTVKRGKRA